MKRYIKPETLIYKVQPQRIICVSEEFMEVNLYEEEVLLEEAM